MRKKAAALLCLLTIMVSVSALEFRPEVRKDFTFGISNVSRKDNLCSLFQASEYFFSIRTPVRSVQAGLGISAGRAESFYNLSTFTGSGDFRIMGFQFLLEMKYRKLDLEVSAGLCALFRGSLSSGFSTLVRTSLCPVITEARVGKLGFALGLPVCFAFNASETVLTAGVSVRVFVPGEKE